MVGWTATTWLTAAVFALYCLELTWVLGRRLHRGQPATYYPLFWVAIVLAPGLIGLQLVPPSGKALLLIAVAATALVVGAAFAERWAAPRGPQPTGRAGSVVVAAVVSALAGGFALGAYRFRQSIATAVGAPFGDLSPQLVRYAQSYLAAGGGLYGLLFSLGGVCAAVVVWLAEEYSRWWLLLLAPLALAVNMSPARTYTLGVVAIGAVFYAYLRANNPRRRRVSRAHVLAGVGAVVLSAGVYFVIVGQSLGKGSAGLDIGGPTWMPDAIKQIVLYFAGGVSALSESLATGFNPSADNPGRSVTIFWRLASAIDPSVPKPSTVAPPIDIPVWFNLYTGPGDSWFELGWLGMVIMFLALGVFIGVLHGRARSGSVPSMFLAASLASSLIASPLNINVFTLNTSFVMLVGTLIFVTLSASRRPGAHAVEERAPLVPSPASELRR